MIRFLHSRDDWGKMIRRPVACPKCGRPVCTLLSRVLSLTPMCHFTCSHCGCICHTGLPPYIVMTFGAILFWDHTVSLNPSVYIPRRYQHAGVTAVVVYILLGLIMMIIFPLKEVREK